MNVVGAVARRILVACLQSPVEPWRALGAKIATFLIPAAGVCVAMTSAYASETYDQAAIEQHVAALLESAPLGIQKWTTPIRFAIDSRVQSPVVNSVVSCQRQLFTALARYAHVQIGEARDVGNANVALFYTDAIDPLLDVPFLGRLLRNPGEAEGQFRDRMRRAFVAGTIRSMGTSDSSIAYSILIVNASTLEFSVGLCLRTVFETFAPHANSDVIQPSLANRGRFVGNDFPMIDLAYLVALYSPQITHGQARDAAIPLMAERMAGYLRTLH